MLKASRRCMKTRASRCFSGISSRMPTCLIVILRPCSAFLKMIDEFDYDHSEQLGDAFEYLLSVLGSQGDAGQFRTPRHIIDFMVAVIDPQEKRNRPRSCLWHCRFLISSYKHILKANRDEKVIAHLPLMNEGVLAKNFTGYDISPDMVRLSLVNMYLHGFADPHIYEYDTLTSQDRWNEYADVILANPPFMSPKAASGRTTVSRCKAKRSEVFFVDYIAEHLTPTAAPASSCLKALSSRARTPTWSFAGCWWKNYLVPSSPCQPACSIRTLASRPRFLFSTRRWRSNNHIAFFKIENDGFDLGAQRRLVEKNDLPLALSEINNICAASV